VSLAEDDRRYLWHPFTQQRGWEQDEPLAIAEADGAWLIGEDGRRYIDGVSSLWCNVHGHRVPEIDAAVRAQLDRVAHSTMLGLANEPAILLAERLIKIAPRGLAKVRSLGTILDLPNPIVGKPGTATVPVGTLPPLRETSNPKP